VTSLYTKAEREEFMRYYPSGCPRPDGYVEFFEWAEAQAGHGLKQRKCRRCQRYYFPQEYAAHVCKPL
jgi:hypothetical protein